MGSPAAGMGRAVSGGRTGRAVSDHGRLGVFVLEVVELSPTDGSGHRPGE